jgi:hypothetical protein
MMLFAPVAVIRGRLFHVRALRVSACCEPTSAKDLNSLSYWAALGGSRLRDEACRSELES